MKENTNKTLVVNSIILYANLIITSVCGFFTTRFALQALGIVDYGLFSVIGSIISFISIVNTIMVSTSNRYIAVAIGKNDMQETNKVFNLCMRIHTTIALITILIAIPLGFWYINNHLNYTGNIQNALFVYLVSVLASIFTFVIVPYHGLLTAKERFFVFSFPSIISHIVRLVLAYLLTFCFEDKLFIYASFMAIMTFYPSLIYILYCKKHFPEIVKFKKIKDKAMFKEILSFSGWVGYGAVAYVGRNQGAAILVNMFFNTVMNTALGIANSINSIVGMISRTITQPIEPQLIKSYTAGEVKRSYDLLILSTKLTYLLVLVASAPFFIECDWILSLWLGQVPPFATMFTVLIIIDTLVDSLNSGVKSIIFASGKIKLFQIIPSTIKLCAIFIAYFVLKSGNESYTLMYVYIVSSLVVVVANQWILHKTININNTTLLKHSYLPSFIVTILFIPLTRIEFNFHPILNISLILTYLLLLIYIIGFSKKERHLIISFITSMIKRK